MTLCEHGCGTEHNLSYAGAIKCRDALRALLDEARREHEEQRDYSRKIEALMQAAEKRAAEAEERATKAVAKWSLVRADQLDAESKLREVSTKWDGLQLALSEQMEERAEYARMNRDLTAKLAEAERDRDALREDRRRALKRADEMTLDTQTCEEAVTALMSTTRVARAALAALADSPDAGRCRCGVGAGETPIEHRRRECPIHQRAAKTEKEGP